MKKILGFIVAAMVTCGSALAADVTVKYSGPSGQGIIIYHDKSTAVTNMALTSRGITNATFVGSVSMSAATYSDDLTVNGDIIGDNATVITNINNYHGSNITIQSTGTFQGDVTFNGDILGDFGTVVTNINFVHASNVTVQAALLVEGDYTANGNVIGDGSTIVTNMSLIESDGFAAGGILGQTVVITNVSTLSTNVLTYTGGILTSATTDP